MDQNAYFHDGDECCENTNAYRPQGLPPVKLGDTFCENRRYKVIHKLGHGGSSTVWLAHDRDEGRYVALKMQAAWHDHSELDAQEYLKSCGCMQLSSVATLQSHFEFDTVNGHHLALVYEFLGPSLRELLGHFKFRPDYARKISRDLVKTIAHLHNNNIAVGDLSTSNILLKYKDLSTKAPRELVKLLGEPCESRIEPLPGKERYLKHAPKSQVLPVDFRDMDLELLTSNVALIDLGDAVRLDLDASKTIGNESFGVHLDVAAPEYVFDISKRHTKESDIWSLACCLFELRASETLFRPQGTLSVASYGIQMVIGDLPQTWISIMQARDEDKNKNLDIISGEEREEIWQKNPDSTQPLGRRLTAIGNFRPWLNMTEGERRDWLISKEGWPADSSRLDDLIKVTKPFPPAKLSEKEYNDFYDLLSKMLRILPAQRLTIEEVFQHPWFNKSYTDLDNYPNWICSFDRGRICMNMEDVDEEDLEEEMAMILAMEEEMASAMAQGQSVADANPVAPQKDTDEESIDLFSVTKLIGLPYPSVEEDKVSAGIASATALELNTPDNEIGSHTKAESPNNDSNIGIDDTSSQEELTRMNSNNSTPVSFVESIHSADSKENDADATSETSSVSSHASSSDSVADDRRKRESTPDTDVEDAQETSKSAVKDDGTQSDAASALVEDKEIATKESEGILDGVVKHDVEENYENDVQCNGENDIHSSVESDAANLIESSDEVSVVEDVTHEVEHRAKRKIEHEVDDSHSGWQGTLCVFGVVAAAYAIQYGIRKLWR